MNTFLNKIGKTTTKAYVATQMSICEALKKLKEKDGTFFVENAMGIVIAVALGGLVIALLFALFKDNIAPQTSTKVNDFFNYS